MNEVVDANERLKRAKRRVRVIIALSVVWAVFSLAISPHLFLEYPPCRERSLACFIEMHSFQIENAINVIGKSFGARS